MKRIGSIALLLCCCLEAAAQCSVCTKTASELDKKGAESLNAGIIYLAFIPVGIMLTLGFVWWRKYRHSI